MSTTIGLSSGTTLWDQVAAQQLLNGPLWAGSLLTFTTQYLTYDRALTSMLSNLRGDFSGARRYRRLGRHSRRRYVTHTSGNPSASKSVANDTQSMSYHLRHRSSLRAPLLLHTALPFQAIHMLFGVRRPHRPDGRGRPGAPPPTPTASCSHRRPQQPSLCPQRPHVPWRPERREERLCLDVRLLRMMHPRFFPWMRAARRVLRPGTNQALCRGPNVSSALCPPRR